METIVPINTAMLIHCDVESPNALPLAASYLKNSNTNLTTQYESKYASMV